MSLLLDNLLAARRPYLLILAFVALVALPGLFSLPPSDRDEARFAQATKQMLETGDIVTIRFLDEARNKKPVGIHWAQAGSVLAVQATLGKQANPVWPYRIPSVLGIFLAACATFGLGAAIVGRQAALLAALFFAATLVAATEARIAKTDAALSAAIAASMLLLVRAYLKPAAFGARHAAGFWLAMGAGILLKGPIAPMVALLAILVLAVKDRGAAWLGRLRPLWGVPLMLAVTAPWFIAIGIATEGKFFADALGGDLGQKLAGADEKHGGLPGYHLLFASATLFPVSLALWAALPAIWKNRAQPWVAALLAWIVPTWLVFELAPTKLPHYVLPTFPALCLLAAVWVLDPQRLPARRWLLRLGAALCTLVVVALGVAAPLLGYLADGRVDPWAFTGTAAAAITLWLGYRAADWPGRALAGLIGAVLLYGAAFGVVLPRLEAPWISPRAATLAAGHPLGSVGYHEPSLPFLAGTETRLLRDGAAAAEFLRATPDGRVLIRDRDAAAFHAALPGARAVGEVRGFNYSRGQRVRLTLYAAP
jgi:4-amino-4-deoxy-L-arabinose transferase-like glycosyltransferase